MRYELIFSPAVESKLTASAPFAKLAGAIPNSILQGSDNGVLHFNL
jgi:hypothetical protein